MDINTIVKYTYLLTAKFLSFIQLKSKPKSKKTFTQYIFIGDRIFIFKNMNIFYIFGHLSCLKNQLLCH